MVYNKKNTIAFTEWVVCNWELSCCLNNTNYYYAKDTTKKGEYSMDELHGEYFNLIEESNYIFNFDNFLPIGKRVLVGKEYGEECRELLNVSKILENSNLTFILSDKIMSINPSFLQSFFSDVIIKYGRDGFLEKVKFKCSGLYNIETEINETISRVLIRENI